MKSITLAAMAICLTGQTAFSRRPAVFPETEARESSPEWLAVDFTTTGAGAPTVQFGTFTGRDFPSGSKGIQPALPPRYVIEPIPDPRNSRTQQQQNRRYVYRVTAMGFGPNAETQAVVQMIYRN